MPSIEVIAALLSFLFTIMILSYVVGDNPLFRIGVHIFIGIAAGYAAAVAVWQVILPRLIMPLLEGGTMDRILLILPLLLSILLLMKISPNLTRLGNPAVAFLVGAGAAAAVAGALLGTIFPQTLASINLFAINESDPGLWLELVTEGAFILVGTIASLAFFHFGARPDASGTGRRNAIMKVIAFLGQIFIAITFGVLFAGAFSATLTALIERLQFVVNFIFSLFS